MFLLLKIIQSAATRGCVHQHVTSATVTSFASRFCCQQRHILTSGQKLPTSVSRLFSRQMPRGPRLTLDAENLSAVITEDIAVYTYRNNRFFLLLTIFGGLQFICWANFAMFVKSDQTAENLIKQAVTVEKDHGSWMTTFYTNNRTKIAAATLSLGCVALFFTLIYPLRTVAQLKLLKGGGDVGVTTYWHFGRTRHLTVPLDHVSCSKSRTASPTHVAMKIRGYWMYFLLDTRSGRFHEPELFDYVIGLKRSLK